MDPIESVFARSMLLQNIFSYLTPEELFKNRLVNKEYWKNAVDQVLARNGVNYNIGYFPEGCEATTFSKHAKYIDRMVTGTWFRNTELIQEFLQQMEGYGGNPFPTKTLIFCMDGTSEGAMSEEGEAAVTTLFNRFGVNIKNVFVLFRNSTVADGSLVRTMLEKLFQLENLTFLHLFHESWPEEVRRLRMDRIYPDPGDFDPSSLGQLEQLQVCGMGNGVIVNCLMKTGSTRRIPLIRLDGVNISYPDPGCPYKLSVGSLMLSRMNAPPWDYSPLKKVEELGISFQHGIMLDISSSTVIDSLKWSDLNHRQTIKKITLRTDEHVGKKKIFDDRTVEDYAHSAEFKYPKLKEVALSYNFLLGAPWVLQLFKDKFPRWRNIHLFKINNSRLPPVNPTEEKDEWSYYPPIYSFEEMCVDLWEHLPDNVNTITTDCGKRASRR